MFKKIFTNLVFIAITIFPLASFSQLSGPGGPSPSGLGGMGGGGGLGGLSGGGIGMGSIGSSGTLIRSVDPLPPPFFSTGIVQSIEPLKTNDFQAYVLETTGYKLPLHGTSFFDNLQFVQKNQNVQASINPYETGQSSSVTADYPIGPGDQIIIRGWGSLEIEVRAVVDRNGFINIPKIGSVYLSGVKFSQSESVIKKAVSKLYKDFQISVTMGQLSTITIFVVGQARRPGSYLIGSTSTLTSAIFGTGGPNSTGSMRKIQLKRSGEKIAEFDLYEFLAKGNSQGDIKLIDGDVIVIPSAAGYAALIGKVNNPAIYELKTDDEALDKLVELAGGFSIYSDMRYAYLDRLNQRKSPARNLIEISLDKNGLKTPITNSDVINFQSITADLTEAVTLRGSVNQSKKIPWREGQRITDVIKSKESLISKESLRRQNEVLFDINQRERTLRQREGIPEDLLEDPVYESRLDLKAIREAKAKNLVSSEQGGLSAFGNSLNSNNVNISNKIAENKQTFSIESPRNIEQFRESRLSRLFSNQNPIKINDRNNNLTVMDSIGSLYEEVNWEYAVIERLDRKKLTTIIIPFNIGRVLDNAEDPENYLLEKGDVITVFSVSDIQVPVSKRKIIVRIEGEIARPGIYQLKPQDKLTDVIERAGGLTHEAYLFGTSFYREEVRKSQVQNLEKLLRKLESETSGQLAQASQSLGATSDSSISQARIIAAQQAQKQALERIRNLKPEGRIALGLNPEYFNHVNNLPQIRMQNGDRIYIPPRPDFVYIYGSVNTESALIHKEGKTVQDYLELGGVSAGAELDSVILIRSDGSALTSKTKWFNNIYKTKVMPGDSIVMPEKLDREASWSAIVRNAKDITQIFYQLGLGAAGLKALGY